MPLWSKNERRRQLLLAVGLLIQCGMAGVYPAGAQGLDMDANSNSPAPAPQSGGLDTDVNPAAPIAPRPSVTANDVPPAAGAPATAVPANVESSPAAAPQTPESQPRPARVETLTLDHPKVVNTAVLQSGDTTVTLYGIEGLSGEPAHGLQAFLGDARVTCQAQETTGFVCLMADGTNVAQAALVNGAAKTAADAPGSYREQEAAAQAARRGIWVNLPPPPETLTHPVVRDTAALWAANKTYGLDGIVGFQAPYAAQLQGYIAGAGDTVTCAPQPITARYICLLPDGTDVAKVALVNGAARVADDAPDAYRVQQLDALNNRRGYWATAPQPVIAAALLPPEPAPQYAFVAGDDGVDGISYVGGEPMAMIDGEAVFLVLGAAGLGWGYYDHYHRWHGAPDRWRAHLDHFHPDGRGLRGYDGFRRDAAFRGREDLIRRDEVLRGREDMMRRDAAFRGREDVMRRDAAIRGREEGFRPGEARPGIGRPGEFRPEVGRPGIGRPGEFRPEVGRPPGEVRPGFAAPMGAARTGNFAMAGARPGMPGPAAAGGFMRPAAAASAGGFRPAMAAPRAAAPSVGVGKHK